MMSSTGRSSGSAVAKSLRGQERLEVGGGDLRGNKGGLRTGGPDLDFLLSSLSSLSFSLITAAIGIHAIGDCAQPFFSDIFYNSNRLKLKF